MNILMLLVALALSAVAAYYSIAGLAAIFAAAIIPIVVMGSILEISKLVLASWLYHNWSELPKLMKSYFFSALVILMCLTSMGIFGYLSKAHLDQAVPTSDVQAKVSLIEEKINQEKEIINESRANLAQLDKQVNEIINRTTSATDTKAVERSISTRKHQTAERKQLYQTIGSAQANIAKLNEEKAPLSTQIRKIEAEVGPIKYIAQLIYGDQVDQTLLEKAVRIVILMIVSVFDPLAVLMLVGYNWSLKHARKEDDPQVHLAGGDDDPITEDTPEYIPYENVKTEEEFFEDGKEIAKAIDKNNGQWDPSLMKIYGGEDTIPSPPPPAPEPSLGVNVATIEEEVEQLNTKGKKIYYDSAGRRITP